MKRKLEAVRRLLQIAGFSRSRARMIALDCRDAGNMGYAYLDYQPTSEVHPTLAAHVRRIFGVAHDGGPGPQPLPAHMHAGAAAWKAALTEAR